MAVHVFLPAIPSKSGVALALPAALQGVARPSENPLGSLLKNASVAAEDMPPACHGKRASGLQTKHP